MTPNGFGPNTRVIMRFQRRSMPADAPLDRRSTITRRPTCTAGNDPLLVADRRDDSFLRESRVRAADPERGLRRARPSGPAPRHERCARTPGAGTSARPTSNAPTETPAAGRDEVWQIANLTADTHPIHFHLVNVQIVSRQLFAVSTYRGIPDLHGPADSARAERARLEGDGPDEPGRGDDGHHEVRACRRSSRPHGTTVVPTPPSPRTGGNEYVWHCHILEHEEHDMMRPLVVG